MKNEVIFGAVAPVKMCITKAGVVFQTPKGAYLQFDGNGWTEINRDVWQQRLQAHELREYLEHRYGG